ncbi:N-acetylmuramoyl-L-alanine amidase [Desulfocurvibacter africanus]|uniref:N-acetylmuramoyl-L-alanine amidase family 2 n=1 Tax=Desulfocurvibacter africanus subsp. africanus str. Walvis Bay TaxID=690850 RepID=F3YY15_DESAF|nr:N-acetylmuramoyl-L-alanine amidase [Desulfocurvibacter africanus]EGJ51791.1 N-acetylmuramoyl-L-alanine amidase family 2 [Desulfocurvibacter africanus subsp. africanus str. Walvis Bay]
MDASKVKYIVIHCADTPPELDIGAAEIDRWHKQNGWDGIGYHYVIRRSGVIESGRPLDINAAPGWQTVTGAHVAGMNSQAIGICLVGGRHGKPDFSGQQRESLWLLVETLKRIAPEAEVVGHRDLDKGKTCPGFDVRAWWANRGQHGAG